MAELMINGEYTLTEMGLVKEVIGSTVIMSVDGSEMEVDADDILLAEIIGLQEEINILLLPIDIESKTIILDANVV